jgi:hypothetical protein
MLVNIYAMWASPSFCWKIAVLLDKMDEDARKRAQHELDIANGVITE